MKFLENARVLGLQTLDISRWFKRPQAVSAISAIKHLCNEILNSDGEYSSQILAKEFFTHYSALSEPDKLELFKFLSREFDFDLDSYSNALERFNNNNCLDSYKCLAELSNSDRRVLFSRLNLVPGATKNIVDLRADLLSLISQNQNDRQELGKLDFDLLLLLRDWFNRGFLDMEQITWQSSAEVLERIIAYEAVHAISSWQELRRRLAPSDRFCFAFFHPSMPGEPLVFIELALTREIPTNIEQVLSPSNEQINPDEAESAIFYSISNCHRGLSGVSFGNFLIKQVVAYLQSNFPQIKNFATISPVPGMAKWLSKKGVTQSENLEDLALEYFVSAKNQQGYPLDPVARFHLRNGAELFRILSEANKSNAGQSQSHGVMVNYLYRPGCLAQNHENYVHLKEVALSSELKQKL